MTAEELFVLPEDHLRHELVVGKLTTRPPAGPRHSEVALHVGAHLFDFVKRHRLGTVFGADCGFILQRNPDTVRAPDASFVGVQGELEDSGYYPGAPDLAIEVISPQDRYSNVYKKIREYMAAGTRMVIVIEPRARTAIVHTSATGIPLDTDDTIDGGDVVPGWKLPLRELFE